MDTGGCRGPVTGQVEHVDGKGRDDGILRGGCEWRSITIKVDPSSPPKCKATCHEHGGHGAQSFSSRAVELQPQRCRPKINSYDRSLTVAQRCGSCSLVPACRRDPTNGCKADRASGASRLPSSPSPRPDLSMAPFVKSPERGSLQGLLEASVLCDLIPGLAFPSHRPAAVPVAAAVMVPKPNPNLP